MKTIRKQNRQPEEKESDAFIILRLHSHGGVGRSEEAPGEEMNTGLFNPLRRKGPKKEKSINGGWKDEGRLVVFMSQRAAQDQAVGWGSKFSGSQGIMFL